MRWMGRGCCLLLLLVLNGRSYHSYSYKHYFRRGGMSRVRQTATEQDSATSGTGYTHSEEARAKISLANKGKLPWNTGKTHPEETRLLIAQRTREAMQKKKLERAMAMGLTLQEYDDRKVRVKKEKQRAKSKGGLTEEGRKRISESMKQRWANPDYKVKFAGLQRGSRNHSAETKAKISNAIKLKWEDEEYRSKIRCSPDDAVRAKISSTLKAHWENPEFRERMKQSSYSRTDEWRSKVSTKIKLLWENGTYRSNVENGHKNSNYTNVQPQRARSRAAPTKRVRMTPDEKLRAYAEGREKARLKELARREAIKAAKKAQQDLEDKRSLKELLGKELWYEEKLKRRQDGDALLNDDDLTRLIKSSWDRDRDRDRDSNEVECEEDDAKSERPIEEWDVDSDENEDVIEVYDEDGELVSTYAASEYARLRASKLL